MPRARLWSALRPARIAASEEQVRRAEFTVAWERERADIGAVADDLTQEVAVRALENYAGFRSQARTATWLYRIAVNVALRYRERQGSPSTPVALEETQHGVEGVSSTADAQPEARLLASERIPRIRAAIDSLPDDLRTALILCIYDELKEREIAAVLEIPIGTVMSRLHSARQRLKVALQKELDDEL